MNKLVTKVILVWLWTNNQIDKIPNKYIVPVLGLVLLFLLLLGSPIVKLVTALGLAALTAFRASYSNHSQRSERR